MQSHCAHYKAGAAARREKSSREISSSAPTRPLHCRSSQPSRAITFAINLRADGSYDAGLTRPQAARQRARRRTGPPSTATVSRWSASDSDASRFDWLDGAKQQQTQVLVDALFAAESVPPPRLPVLLALLEGRPDLEQALVEAGLPAAAAAVLRSDLLQRLLPGGLLLETLMGLIEDRATELPAEQLLMACRLVAAWHPPNGCEALGPASASLATAIADAVLAGPDSTGEADKADSRGSGGSSADFAATAGMLADALTLLQPWLAWRASGSGSAAAAAGTSAASAAALGLLDAGVAAAEEAAEAADALAAARGAAEALLRRPEVAAAADTGVLLAVTAAAAAYDVEVPRDLARTAVSLASTASSSSPTASAGSSSTTSSGAGSSSATTAAELAAQLVAASVAGAAGGAAGHGRGRGRNQLSGEELESVVWARLASEVGAAEHAAFLRELLGRVRQMAPGSGRLQLQPEEQQHEQQPGSKAGEAGPADEQQAARRALVVALGSAAGGLGPDALALAAECAAAVFPGDTIGDGADALASTAAAELLGCAADASAEPAAACTADQVCRLAAAVLALRARVGASVNETAVARVLAAAEAVQLQSASTDAVAALVAAAAVPGGGLALPPPLVDALLVQLTAAAATAAPVEDVAVDGSAGTAKSGRKQEAAPAAAAVAQLTPQQAAALLEVAVAAAEEAAQAAAAAVPSSSTAAEPATPAPIPPQRAAVLCAAIDVAMRLLTPSVRRVDSVSDITRLLVLAQRCQRAGLRPREQRGLLWAAHERLRVLGLSMSPAEAVGVLRACAALKWAPSVLFSELLLPLLRQLQASAAAAAAAAGGPSPTSGAGSTSGADDTSALGAWGEAGSGGAASRPWTLREVRSALALLAAVGYDGPMAASLVKLGVGELLRAHHVAATAASRGNSSGAGAEGEGALLGAEDMAQLLWVCVALRYRGGAVLRPLLQLLLLVPAPQVSVRAAAQAVWAAARLGVVGERLVRWALAACQGQGKLAAAPPQSLANLCWGLGKLGVKPPRAFVTAMAVASLGQLPRFKPQELATTAFVLATWGGRLGAAASGLVRHVVATRSHFDGPALCVAAWAVQRLAAAPPADATADAGATADVTPGLDAASLGLLEQRLLEAVQEAAHERRGRPGTGDFLQSLPGVADHHLLRFFSAASAAGYRPAALLAAYCDALLPRLQRFNGCSPAAAGAARRARLLWSAARVLQTFRVTAAERPELLAALEHAAEQCQAILGPQALAGVLSAMSDLGYYPAGWAARGLLRCVRLGLVEADATEAAAIVAALAAWSERLEEGEAAAAAAAAAVAAGGEDGRQGNGLAAAGGEEAGNPSRAAKAAKPAPGGKQAVSRRLDLLRQVAVARLTELCVPPPVVAAAVPGAAAAAAAQGQALPSAAGAAAAAPSPAEAPGAGLAPAAAASAAAAAAEAPSAGGAIPQPSIEPEVALSLLRSLARLRWHSDPLEGALVRAAAALTADPAGRRRVPALTTLLWAMASLRQDVPELLDDLQAALMGLPRNTRSLAEEVALLESGRLAGALGADSQRPPAPPSVPPVQPVQPVQPAAPPVQQHSQAAADPTPTPEASAQPPVVSAAAQAAAQPRPSPAASPSTPSTPSTSTTASAAASNNHNHNSTNGNGLLARPNKPAVPTPATADTASPTASLSSLSSLSSMDGGAGGGFDTAAATAAAAAALNQRLEQQLVSAAGRGRLASEPWAPVDVFKALWACAKMNRHPGPQILAAAERSWLLHTTDGAAGGAEGRTLPPLHTITGLLWSLSVFRHHNSAFAQQLAAQLAARLGALAAAAAADGGEADGAAAAAAALEKQAPQLAACLLAAAADRTDSPLNAALAPEARGRLLNVWRARQAERVARPPGRYQTDLVSVLRKMGYTAAANVATPDGVAVADVAVAVTPNAGLRAASTASASPGTSPTSSTDSGDGAAAATAATADAGLSSGGGAAAAAAPAAPRLLALELVGRHNSAANSPRIMGEAVIKYRLLQAHGYLVVPVSCYEWDRISHQDVWTKMVYLQAKIDRRTGTGLAASSVSAAAAAAAAAPAAGVEGQTQTQAVSAISGLSRSQPQ